MLTAGFLIKPLATLLARAVLTKLLSAELSGSDIAETLTDSLGIGDLIERLTDDDFAKKSVDVFFLRIGRQAAESLEEVFRLDGSQLAPALTEQTAEAISETLKSKALPLLIKQNLQKAEFDAALSKVKIPSTLAAEAHDLFRSALRATSDRIFAIADTLPNFTRDTTAELLLRIAESTDILQEIKQKLVALEESQRQSVENNPFNQQDRIFEKNYRTLLLRELDLMELFGISDIDSNYRPPLSAAFINLRTIEIDPEDKKRHSFLGLDGLYHELPRLEVAQAVAQTQRTLVVGGAGMGKTTLLRWIAVRVAAPGTGEQAAALEMWNGKVPIYLRLRDFPRGDFPDFDQLLVAFPPFKALKGSLRPGWTTTLLASGRCVLLFDGLDEVSLRQCKVALDWLEKLLALYPDKLTCIATTRPATLEKPEIKRCFARAGFTQLHLAKMEGADVDGFIERWHRAMADPRAGLPAAQREQLPQLEATLRNTLVEQAALRALADTPLLCAMICAVNQRRNGNLPANRLELYKLCSEMLLAARDSARNIRRSDYIQLSAERLQAQVAKLAYWMMQNGERVVKRRDAIHQLGLDLDKKEGERVLALLLDHCLLLREQSKQEIEFAHGSFQEYLAATEIIYRNEIGIVCKRYGAESDWKETILLVASHELDEERQMTLLSKLNGAASDADKMYQVHVLALEAFSLMRRRHAPAVVDLATQHAAALVHNEQNTDSTTTHSLALSNTQVSDVTALAKLTGLQTLYLWDTQVSDVTALAKLTALRELYLYSTQVSDVTALAKLTALQLLALSNTQVSDVTALAKLTALQKLYLSDTQVSDVTALAKLIGLQRLHLSNTQVSDVTVLGKLTALRELNLSSTQVRDVTVLGKLTALQTLDLSNTQVSDVTALAKLIGLQRLHLSNTQVSDVTVLGKLTALRELNLSSTQVRDVTALAKLTALQTLDLSDTQVSDVTVLGKLSNLQMLLLNKVLVSDLDAIAQLPSLWVLDVRGCPVVEYSPLLQIQSLRAIWMDEPNSLPSQLRQRMAVNPAPTPYGEGPWHYLNWLRAEQRRQEEARKQVAAAQ